MEKRKYNGLVDSDNYIDLTMFRTLYVASQEKEAGIVSSSVNEVRENVGIK